MVKGQNVRCVWNFPDWGSILCRTACNLNCQGARPKQCP
jgi:hypothetical protein